MLMAQWLRSKILCSFDCSSTPDTSRHFCCARLGQVNACIRWGIASTRLWPVLRMNEMVSVPWRALLFFKSRYNNSFLSKEICSIEISNMQMRSARLQEDNECSQSCLRFGDESRWGRWEIGLDENQLECSIFFTVPPLRGDSWMRYIISLQLYEKRVGPPRRIQRGEPPWCQHWD